MHTYQYVAFMTGEPDTARRYTENEFFYRVANQYAREVEDGEDSCDVDVVRLADAKGPQETARFNVRYTRRVDVDSHFERTEIDADDVSDAILIACTTRVPGSRYGLA